MKARARSPKPTSPTRAPIERKAPRGALEQPFLPPRPHRPVGRGHASAEVDRHAQRHFGDRPRESRARREHMDAAGKAGVVIDVLQEIGLDIDDGAEFRRAVEPALSACRSGRSGAPSRQQRLEPLGRHAARPLVDREFAEALEAAPDPPARRSRRGPAAADRSRSAVWPPGSSPMSSQLLVRDLTGSRTPGKPETARPPATIDPISVWPP